MKYFIKAFQNYAVFSGRATRSEYWYFVLFNLIFAMILAAISKAAGMEMISNIYSIAVVIPGISVGVRRMHDVDKSGWFLLIPIYNLVLACTDGTPGSNRFGEDPKGSGLTEDIEQIGTNQ